MTEKKVIDFVKQGKNNRIKGQLFETRVREDLEEKGWTVTKWMNTVNFERDKVVPAKRKYNPFTRALAIGTGFPDLLCFKKTEENYEVIGVEVKSTGSLDKIEKGMCIWYLEKKIIPRILVAKKTKVKNKIVVVYTDFREKFMNKV